MASPPSQATDLTTLTLDAVRALLREIASGTATDVGGASHPVGGTYASVSAQALRDLMQCEPLTQIVQYAVNDELNAGAGR